MLSILIAQMRRITRLYSKDQAKTFQHASKNLDCALYPAKPLPRTTPHRHMMQRRHNLLVRRNLSVGVGIILTAVVCCCCSVSLAFVTSNYNGSNRSVWRRVPTFLPAVSDKSLFLTPETAQAAVQCAGGTPCYVYSLSELERFANACRHFPNAYGLTVRYAMKACPNSAILQFMHAHGIHIDASSGYEAHRALHFGVPAAHISLSTQELPFDFADLVKLGVKMNACSLTQLERFGQELPGGTVGIRINPGVGSGGFSASTTSFSKTNVGGPSSSFGIWHELVTNGSIQAVVDKYDLTIERIHTHIGSGSDPDIWQQVAQRSLSFCALFETVHTLNLGGGYKVGRNAGETTTDLQAIGAPVVQAFEQFAANHDGRQLHLEIEPGTYLVAMAGALVSTVQDKVQTTGPDGHVFLKLDAGMTDVLRPSLYGAVHPMTVLPGPTSSSTSGLEQESVVVVGHCCESGDLMTPQLGQPEALAERMLRKANIGDYLVLDGAGAYCAGMSTKNYNSFPEAAEVLVDAIGQPHLIRARQPLEQIWQNEVPVSAKVLTSPAVENAQVPAK